LVWLAKKYGPKWVHFCCLILAGVGLLAFPHIEDKHLLFAPMTGFGIAWASMMGVPYMLVVGSIPKERFGVYMGIINMMIVIPMIFQTLSFGAIYKHFLGNNPSLAITMAGTLLLIAALAVLRIRMAKSNGQEAAAPMGGGH
jgi:maltose/moltooligosaccharide transporter